MKIDRKKILNYLVFLSIALLVFCVSTYILDFRLGNGDGLISRFNFSPLVVLLFGQLVLLSSFLLTCQKTWLSNTGLVAVSTISVLVLSELTLHLFIPHRGGHRIENLGNRPIFSRQDPVYFKNYLPNGKFLTHVDDLDGKFSVLNEINTDGIRGPEIGKKLDHENRILLLGDSYLQSDEIEFDKTIGQVLESLLPDTFNVIQHGSPSWSPLLELNWLLKKGLGLKPNCVVLFLVYNDFYRGSQGSDIGYKQYCIFDDDGYPKAFHFDGSKIMKPWIQIKEGLGHLKLVKLVRTSLDADYASRFRYSDYLNLLAISAKDYEKANDHFGFMATMRDTSIWDGETKDRVELSMHYLKLVSNVLEREGIKFAIALVPHALQFSSENVQFRDYVRFDDYVLPESGLQQRIRKFCYMNNIRHVSLYDEFKRYKKGTTDLLYFINDGHWNSTGHSVAAESVYLSLFSR